MSPHTEATTIRTSPYHCIAGVASCALEVQSSLLLKVAASENGNQGLSSPSVRFEPFTKDFKANAMQAILTNRRL
ncbi:hypothetical protein HBI51_253100, partial [Parastagonospora nodorum]